MKAITMIARDLFPGKYRVTARAFFLAERLDVRSLEEKGRIGSNPSILSAGSGGYVVFFRYGAVVLFGMTEKEEKDFIDSLRPYLIKPIERPEREEIHLLVDLQKVEGIENGHVILNDFRIERLQLVAEVLGRCVVLNYYETSVAESFGRIEPLAENLRRLGRPGSKGRELLRHIGDTLSTQGSMVGRVEISEKPDLLWNHPEFERLYARLEDEYELRERHMALERKLDLISRTAETLLDLLQNKRSLRVEWYITILIVFEILLSLYEIFLVGKG